MDLERDRDLQIGFVLSFLGHLIIAYLFFYGVRWNYGELGAHKIYSVTLEGGKSLGGITQAPKEKQKTLIAPPKNVQEPPKKVEPSKPEPKKEDPKPVEKKPPPDAEISLKQKKEQPKPGPKKEEKKAPPQKSKPKEPTQAEIDKRLQQAVQRYLGESANAGGKGFGAGALGAKGMGGGIVRPPEFFEYLKLLERLIKGGWRWYDTNSPLISEVEFNISRSGEISGVRISKSSGNSEFDLSVERAVMKANPLPPPPESVYQDFRFVRMYFDPRE
ncbi:MAG: TonB family protein [Deltaproteobacteria bacterium]|nr:TonB family protein [Deltaproteobacteria bacterium]